MLLVRGEMRERRMGTSTNFEKEKGRGPGGPGWGWISARPQFAEGASQKGQSGPWKGDSTAVLAKHVGGPRFAPIRLITGAWRPWNSLCGTAGPSTCQFPLLLTCTYESHLAICQSPCVLSTTCEFS